MKTRHAKAIRYGIQRARAGDQLDFSETGLIGEAYLRESTVLLRMWESMSMDEKMDFSSALWLYTTSPELAVKHRYLELRGRFRRRGNGWS